MSGSPSTVLTTKMCVLQHRAVSGQLKLEHMNLDAHPLSPLLCDHLPVAPGEASSASWWPVASSLEMVSGVTRFEPFAHLFW